MRTVLVVMFLMTTTMVFAADNWSHFRGDRGDGRADSAQLPLELGEGKNVKWKVPISGKGWSSPVIWENQIWLTTATVDGKKMRALCLDRASGKMIHDILVFENEPDDIRF